MSPLPDPKPFPATRKSDSLNVLILEDERHDRHRLARYCASMNRATVISNASSLQEFSMALEQKSYELILLDYMLPDGNGVDALQMARCHVRNLNAAALMITGWWNEEAETQARALGCAAFLKKDNLTPETFLQAASQALRSRSAGGLNKKGTYTDAETAHLLSLHALRSARDVKPMVSRMMRQLRDMRARLGEHSDPGLQALEQNCLSLWAFLVETEQEEGAAILADLTNPQALSPAIQQTVGASNSRPSVFGPRPH